MNEVNTKTLDTARASMTEAINLLIDVLKENERMTSHLHTVVKERDDAWTRNTKLNLLDIENKQLCTRLEAETKARDNWASRFRALEADMRGMESMLNDERARVKAHMEQNACHQQTIKDLTEECHAWRKQGSMTPTQIEGLNRDLEHVRACNIRQADTIREKNAKLAALQTQHDTLERNNAQNERIIKEYQTTTRANALVVAAEARFESMKLERDKAQDEVASAKLGLQAAGDVINHVKLELAGRDETIRVLRINDRELTLCNVRLKDSNAELNKMHAKQAKNIGELQETVGDREFQIDALEKRIASQAANERVLHRKVDMLNEEIEGLKKSVATAWTQTTQTPIPPHFPVGTTVYVRRGGCVTQHEIAKVQFEIIVKDTDTPAVYYVFRGEGGKLIHADDVFNTSEAAFASKG